MKAKVARAATAFEHIPNVGPRVARDFKTLGFLHPRDLKGKDPFILYQTLCVKTKVRHDPCLLDVFMSAVDFMDGQPARPWWFYTPLRKKKYPDV